MIISDIGISKNNANVGVIAYFITRTGNAMNYKEYLKASSLCFGKASEFFNLAISIKWRYIIFHFMLILCLLFIPLFVSLIKTQPDILYERMLSLSFDNANIIYCKNESFSSETFQHSNNTIFVFEDYTVYNDASFLLSAPTNLIFDSEREYNFRETFSRIAMYNMYIIQVLIPVLLIAFLITFVLQMLFYVISAIAIGVFRLTSSRFEFNKKLKLVILNSLLPALLSLLLGFLLPTVHIIVFQVLNLLLILFLFKKIDRKQEKEIFN
ncbi:MAG: hypothetical protein RR234_00425 [Christensenella sp.]